MIFKSFIIGDFNDDLPSHLLNVGSTGVDKVQFQKIASSFHIPDLNPEKGHAYIHLITTGAGDYYGANNNADFFPERAGTFHFPISNKEASLEGGLKEYHKTYKQYGGVYHHHRNSKKGFEKQGEVVWETYNEPMHRGEVIIKVKEDLQDSSGNLIWADALEKLSRDEIVPWSQGCSVPFDVCSGCGNEAKTQDEHCEHIKGSKLRFHKSGQQIYMINHMPYFHDISMVHRPADRIALSLQKVASNGPSYMECSPEGMVIPVSLVEKIGGKDQQDRYNLLVKLAQLEKEVLMMPKDVIGPLACSHTLNEGEENQVVASLKDIPEDLLIKLLKDKEMLLTPRTFSIIVLKKQPEEVPGFNSIPMLLRDVFSEILEHGDPNEFLSDGSYKPCNPISDMSSDRVVGDLSGLLGTSPDQVRHRIIKMTIRPEQSIQKVAAEPTKEAGIIAKEYAKYQLSYLASGRENIGRERYIVSVNQNY